MGDRLGEWTLDELIGRGGMGRVFLARDAEGSARAVKVILREDAEWMQMRSFVDEAMVAIRLRHPNIVRTFELGEEQGTFFLVMEYVAGCSLDVLLDRMGARGKGIDPGLAAWIVCEIAAALEHAHSAEVIHRDVSPHNVLLGPTGDVKLTDFGIAKATGRAERTRTGVIKGKIRYMAPEQARGEEVDARTDVYALALVLWQMLTLRRPFGDLAKSKLLRAVQRGGLQPPSTFADDIPLAIEAPLMAALATDPALRPHGAAAFAERLRASLPTGGEAVSALTTLLFEFTGHEMHTASMRTARDRETRPEKSETRDLRPPRVSAEVTKRWTRDVELLPVHEDAWSLEDEGGAMPTTSREVPLPRRPAMGMGAVAVVSFVVGIVIAGFIVWMLSG